MWKPMVLWVLFAFTFVVTASTLFTDWGLGVTEGAVTFVVLMLIVTRLIFDSAFRESKLKERFFYYIISLIAAVIVLYSSAIIIDRFYGKISLLVVREDPNKTLFEQYQERLRIIRGESDSIAADAELAEVERQEMLVRLNNMQSELEVAQRKIAEGGIDHSWEEEYENEEFGFELTFFGPWKGYKVSTKQAEDNKDVTHIYFDVPILDKEYGDQSGYASPVAISVLPNALWEAVKDEPGPRGAFLASSKDRTFIYGQWQDPPKELLYTNFDVPRLISSFKLLEKD